ncbi:unnamed protein product [Prunus brigantina]
MGFHLPLIFALFSLAAVALANHAAQLYWNSVLPNTQMPRAISELLRPDSTDEEKSTNVMNAVGNGKPIDHKGKPENTILPQLARRPFSYKSDNRASEEGGSKTMTGNIANEELLEINIIHGRPNPVEGKEARSRFEKRRAEKVRRINGIASVSESAKALEKVRVISFTQKDMEGIEFPHNDALVVTLRLVKTKTKRKKQKKGSDDHPTDNQLHYKNVAIFFLEKDMRPGTTMSFQFPRNSNTATFLP